MRLSNISVTQPFQQRHLLTMENYNREDILTILKLAYDLKVQRREKRPHHMLSGKKLAMIFTKSSTRTRVSFETGIYELGGMGLFLSSSDIQLGRGETIADTARTLSRMVDGIMIRTFDQKDVEDLARYGSVPVINGLTDVYHPCQALADLMTLFEFKPDKGRLKLAFVGDGNNVAHSLLVICAKLGVDIAVATPEGYAPDEAIVRRCQSYALTSGANVTVCREAREAVYNADAVYTDVWASMGQESQFEEKSKSFAEYQVTPQLMDMAAPGAIFLHCLPAHRGEEVTADVIDSPRSAVFDQAENRLHVQKAVMALLMR